MSEPVPELHAPNDSAFVYEPYDSPPWRWRTLRPYAFELDPKRYPALALAATIGHATEATSPAGIPYGMLTRIHGAHLIGVVAGYAWDGSTGGSEGVAGRRASCLHDTLYQIMRRYELGHFGWDTQFRSDFRADADRLFYDVQRADGMPWWRRTVRWLAVRTWPGNVRRQGMAVYDGDKGEVQG